jgi:XTP/dITP diphosphohydrolase
MPPTPASPGSPSETLIVLATGNPHKVVEISEILAAAGGLSGVRLVAASGYAGIDEPEETGSTFAENALLKARYWAKATGQLALADDSGIVVDALGGRPGVHSARYDSTSERRNQKLLAELRDVPPAKRAARFVCVAAIADPQGCGLCEEGRIEGWITDTPRGTDGFGYDPVFEPAMGSARAGRTLAEYSAAEKNEVSHRGRAFTSLAPRVVEAAKAGQVVTVRRS